MKNTIATIVGGICVVIPQIIGESSGNLFVVLKDIPWSDPKRTEYVISPPQDIDTGLLHHPRMSVALWDRQVALANVLSWWKTYHWFIANRSVRDGWYSPIIGENPLNSINGREGKSDKESAVTSMPSAAPIGPPLPLRKERLEEWVRATVPKDVERYGITQAWAQELIISLFDILVDKVERDEEGRINVYIREKNPALTNVIDDKIQETLKVHTIDEQEGEQDDSTKTKKPRLLVWMKNAATSIVTKVAPWVEEDQIDKIVATLMSWLIGRNDCKAWSYRLWLGKAEVGRKDMMHYLHEVVTIPLLTHLKDRDKDKTTGK